MFLGNILSEYSEYEKLKSSVLENTKAVSVSGVVESANGCLISALTSDCGVNSMVITYSDMEAKSLHHDLEFYTSSALYFPSKEYTFHDIETSDHQREHERLEVLDKLCFGKDRYIVVTSLEAIMDYTVDYMSYKGHTISLEVGNQYPIDKLEERLIYLGYVREDMAEGKGQFSVRGGIVDIFCPNSENPIRIEFFDDEIDSIREFDAMSQRSLDMQENARITPCTEILLNESKRQEVIDFLKNTISGLKRKKTNHDLLIETLQRDIEHFQERYTFPSIDKYVSLIHQNIPSLFDYLKPDDLVFVIEPKRMMERNKSLEWERGELIHEFMERGMLLGDGLEFWLNYNNVVEKIQQQRLIAIEVMNHTSNFIPYQKLCDFLTKTTVSLHGKIEYLYEDLEHWKKQNATVVILASNRGRGENLVGTLNDKGIRCRYLHEQDEINQGEIVVMRGNLNKGFEFPQIKFALISDQDIFLQKRRRTARKVDNANRIKSYNDINVGDYVVHQAHGIGSYAGIHQMVVGGVTKDYLKINYQGTDTLYVPVDQLNMLYKYIGNSDSKIKVSKLGGTDWTKTKAKVKKSTKDLAEQLIRLYSQRENAKGYAFTEDTPWQREFEDTFLYQETDDQLRSIEEVKKDMEQQKPMDRLLCGDVGYGKTEIALRAAFKAATDSKQVAYLCPTTILAMQQYNSFCQRMEGFPIKVEMLSRFRTPPQQKKILKQLKTGEIDILIGTHRILQKDLEFKDLGLLVVDEEQRFGVTHKERLKELKTNVDVLTMTATPIPRTLHMAMIHVRDMSVLEEPPQNRYPVQTYVLEQNPQVLVDAMKKELARGGQVFYLFNRVQGIYRTAQWIQAMIPDAKIAVGHGKMKEDELEDIMYDMVNGKTDILVCTTIIETGLDIPNANTIIIENADKMGLSQLYQLRGRVGRSNRTAYAYLTYKKDGALSDVAQKRLRAIKEFTEFGSGFKIAMRDLEIRGAGNLLGAQQHGHMDSVGYDMYCKLLKESVDEAQGIETSADVSVSIDIEVDAYIPDRYIKNQNQRIDVYKKIASIENEEDSIEIHDELIDRYGDLPKSAMNLIQIALVKSIARQVGVYEIAQKNGNILFKFQTGKVTMESISVLVNRFPSQILFSASEKPYLTYRTKSGDKKKLMENIKFILQTINELKK